MRLLMLFNRVTSNTFYFGIYISPFDIPPIPIGKGCFWIVMRSTPDAKLPGSRNYLHNVISLHAVKLSCNVTKIYFQTEPEYRKKNFDTFTPHEHTPYYTTFSTVFYPDNNVLIRCRFNWRFKIADVRH